MPTFFRRVRDALAKVRGMWGARALTSRMDEEMRLHVEMAAEQYVRDGMSHADARRAAHVAFGGRERFREDTRDEFRSRALDDFGKDVGYALRNMRRQPTFALTVVVTLALGIGAFTAVFSLVNRVLIDPLPYASSGRLVTLWQHWQDRPPGPHSISPAEYFDYVDGVHTFDAWGVYYFGVSTILGDDDAVRLPRASVSSGVLRALGVQPVLGHIITEEEDRPGVASVVLISAGLWRTRYAADSGIVGKAINLSGGSATVIGVLPDDFHLPDDLSSPAPAQLFTPMALSRDQVTIRGSHYLSSVALLSAGTSVPQANADISGVMQRFTARNGDNYPKASQFGATVIPLHASVSGDSASALWLLLATVSLVLVIACANAANLLLARADARRGEIAIRAAMGAARARLVRQLLTESLVLASVAGAAGIALAEAATRAFAQWHPVALPGLATLSVDGRVLATALAVTFASAMAFGLAPALQLVKSDVHKNLGGAGRGATGTAGRRRARRVLVAGELAVTVALLLCASLLAKSFARTLAVDPGFRVDHTLTVSIAPPHGVYDTDDKAIALFAQLGERARALPGVRAAGFVAGVPLVAPRGDIGIEFEGHPLAPGEPHPKANWQVVTPGYFEALGMRMVSGREVDEHDVAGARGVAVVNETMAKRFWPAGDALGKRFKLGGGAKPDTATVIGVVADVRQAGLSITPDPEMYLAHAQFRFWGGGGSLPMATLVLRTDADPAALAPVLRAAIHAFAPSVPAGAMQTMEELRTASVAQPRLAMLLVAGTAAIAFVIAIVGLYGIVAYTVAQRRKEFGVRLAFGAQRSDITRMVLQEGIVIGAAGVAIGLPLAFAAGRALQGFLFGVRVTDPVVVVLVPAGLMVVSLIASYVPARRAATSDPIQALRVD